MDSHCLIGLIWCLMLPLVHGNLISSVIQEIHPHQDVYILSDSLPEEETIQKLDLHFKFLYSTYHYNRSLSSANNYADEDILNSIRRIFQSTEDVAVVVCMSTENVTLQTITFVGKVFDELRELRRVWTVVVWPTSIKNLTEIDTLSKSPSYLRSVKNLYTNSQLFLTFDVVSASSGVANHETLIYESYRASNSTFFRRLHTGIMQWGCQFCAGLSVRRFNFHQSKLKVTAVNDSEINDDLHVYKDSNGTISYSKNGFSGSLFGILRQLLNFTTVPKLSLSFGSRNPETNLWEGSIGDVAAGRADLAISVTIFQPDRAAVVSFLPPADEHLIDAFFTPSKQSAIRDIFAQPFKPSLWAAVVTTWVVLASCMILFSAIRKRYGLDKWSEANGEEKSEADFSKDSFIWALGTVCQQGWDEHPRASSLRAIFISGSFTGVVAYAGYSAAIVSTLSLNIDPIRTPMELLQSNLHVGVRKGFISILLNQKNAKDTMSLFYKKVEHSYDFEKYLNVSSGFNRLRKHPYAFITTRDTIYDLMKATVDDNVICDIKDLPMLKYGFPLGYPVPKYSPFREILRYAMTMIREPGVLYRLRLKHGFQRRCREASNNAGKALGATDVFTALMILLGGFVLSLSFLAIERIIPRTKPGFFRS